MGRFTVRSRSRNNYIVLAYHVDTYVILVEAFQSHQDRHRLAAAKHIMYRLHKLGHTVDLHILDNECRKAYKLQIKSKWGAKFQLATPDLHCRNTTEWAIHNFKANFLPILAGVSESSSNFLWDQLLHQTELTLNLLRKSNIYPSMSAWEHYHGPFNYNTTSIGTMGFPVITHNNPTTRKS